MSAREICTSRKHFFDPRRIPMYLQIASVSVIGIGVVTVTAWAFYRQGQKISRQQNITLQSQAASLSKQLAAETERANRATVRLEQFKRETLYKRDPITGRMGHYSEPEEFFSEG
jgi:hypothetical protein